jgi:hypothetical protein
MRGFLLRGDARDPAGGRMFDLGDGVVSARAVAGTRPAARMLPDLHIADHALDRRRQEIEAEGQELELAGRV